MSAVASRTTMRNRKVECSAGCEYFGRYSMTMLRRGLPGCGACGAPCWPAELEDAVGLLSAEDLERHPAWQHFVSKASSIQHGQAWRGGLSKGAHYADASIAAAAHVHECERKNALARKLAALRGPDAVSEVIPF